jgi:hypothetical protein
MVHAAQLARTNAHLRSARRSGPLRPADRALSDLLARIPASLRNQARRSAFAAAREASAWSERESSRCACGGTCPKCQAQQHEDLDERHTAEREARRPPKNENEDMDGAIGVAPGNTAAGALAAPGIEDDPVVEYSNGTTTCDRDTGTMTTVINNTKCTRPCTVEHEADHRAYRGDCCRAYATARSAAIADGDTTRRNALTQRYNAWISATSDYSECRAYRVSVACGERMQSDLSCSRPTEENRACCGDVRTYLASMRSKRDSRCPGTDQACPDFSA